MATIEEIRAKLKTVLVEGLNLEDIAPEDIVDADPLFGDGLGLDSLDAVEVVLLVEKHFGVQIKDMDEGRPALQSVNALAEFIVRRRSGS